MQIIVVFKGTANISPAQATLQTLEAGFYESVEVDTTNAYNSGYEKGVLDSVASTTVSIKYHSHTSSCSSSCPGYTDAGSARTIWDGTTRWGKKCGTCGAYYLSTYSGSQKCTGTYKTCGKTDSTIESITINGQTYK